MLFRWRRATRRVTPQQQPAPEGRREQRPAPAVPARPVTPRPVPSRPAQAATGNHAGTKPFTVLVVCTGNICRSPAVERLLAHALGPDAGVRVVSAGVGAVVGAPVAPVMAQLLRSGGVSPDDFAARQVSEAMLREAQLVITMTRAHRARVVELTPAVVRRSFTLRELARLAVAVGPDALPAGTPGERFAALVPLAAAQRGQQSAEPTDDDVVDPWGGDQRLYDESYAQLRPAVDAIVRVVRGDATL